MNEWDLFDQPRKKKQKRTRDPTLPLGPGRLCFSCHCRVGAAAPSPTTVEYCIDSQWEAVSSAIGSRTYSDSE
jgi:hypothetical protein